MTKFVGIIPARYASTRFPGKPLADIGGMTMIERVYTQASRELDNVWVATDDTRIYDAVEAFGGRVVMTSPNHRSGTDRCHEAMLKVAPDADAVINIQGDEPFIDPTQIARLKETLTQPDTEIATLVRQFDPATGFDALFQPQHAQSGVRLLYACPLLQPLDYPLCEKQRLEAMARQCHFLHPYRHVWLSCRCS